MRTIKFISPIFLAKNYEPIMQELEEIDRDEMEDIAFAEDAERSKKYAQRQ